MSLEKNDGILLAVRIREITEKDFTAVRKIFVESSSFHEQVDSIFASINEADQIWINYITTIFQQDDFKIYVALRGEQIVGFCVGQIIEKPPVYQVKKIGQVNNIAVKEGHKRQGIGKVLSETINAWFMTQQVNHIELLVATNNPQSLGFWNKMGGREFMKKMVIQI